MDVSSAIVSAYAGADARNARPAEEMPPDIESRPVRQPAAGQAPARAQPDPSGAIGLNIDVYA